VSVLHIIVCPFVPFVGLIVLSDLLRLSASEYQFGIFKLFFLTPIATKVTNHKHVMRDLNIHDFKFKHPDCTFVSSSSIYNQACHVISGDLNILRNTFLLAKSVAGSWD